MKNKGILLLWITINNDVINNLRVVDDFDEGLNFVIKAYVDQLESLDVVEEIFEIGNTYLVTEKAVYIAVYEDELS